MSFSVQQQRELLAFVRGYLAAHLSGEVPPPLPPFPELSDPGCCFVTLYEAGELRGCIGTVNAVEPLGENLKRNAINAGCADPRFPPLAAAEMNDVSIEISVLTPLRKVAGPEAIRLGRDGIMIRLNGRSALFLPQVATEQQWDLEETLFWLCRKAGLGEDAWRDPAMEFLCFETEVLGEKRQEKEEFDL